MHERERWQIISAMLSEAGIAVDVVEVYADPSAAA